LASPAGTPQKEAVGASTKIDVLAQWYILVRKWEAGNENAGFERTPEHQSDYISSKSALDEQWFDGGQLTQRNVTVLSIEFSLNSVQALMGKFQEIQTVNRLTKGYDSGIYALHVGPQVTYCC
jgi:hypothetical protein